MNCMWEEGGVDEDELCCVGEATWRGEWDGVYLKDDEIIIDNNDSSFS